MRVNFASWTRNVWKFALSATIIIGIATASSPTYLRRKNVVKQVGDIFTTDNAKNNIHVTQVTPTDLENINSAVAEHVFRLLNDSVDDRRPISIDSMRPRLDRNGSTPSIAAARNRLRGRETSSGLSPSLTVPSVPRSPATIPQPRSLDAKVTDEDMRNNTKATKMRKQQNRPKLPINNIDPVPDFSSDQDGTEKLSKTVRQYIESDGYPSKLQLEAIQFENEKKMKNDGEKSKLANNRVQYKYPNRPISTKTAIGGIETGAGDTFYPTTVTEGRDLPIMPKSSAEEITPKIINGEDAPLGMYPWYVGLGEGFCGGTLVAPEFILTAAHCLGGFFDKVTVGKFCTDRFDNCGQEKDVMFVKEIIPHPNFRFTQGDEIENMNFDIGLVKIERTGIIPARMDLDGVSSQYANGEWSPFDI